jgi:hypothetical protein
VALVETTGGVEYGATTEFGILTLGRTATEGPCRVHYFLGPTALIEEGSIAATGSGFYRANIDLQTQHLRVLARPVRPDDELLLMWTTDGQSVESIRAQLEYGDGISGDVLADPGADVPAGASLFARTEDQLLFVGLVSARATLHDQHGERRCYTFAGFDRVRELVAVPEVWPTDWRARFRPDGIIVREPIR